MKVERELLLLQRRVRRMQVGLACVAVAGTAGIACGARYATGPADTTEPSASASFAELTVERLNVREPDGTLRMVISNQARAPDPVMGGKSVPGRKGGNQAGLIFYDGNGNESGGLVYGGKERNGAGSWFAFDRHDQDQTLGIGYAEGPGGRYESGVYIWDRPEATSAELMPKYDRIGALPQGPERDALIETMQEAGEFERFRGFFGRDDTGTAMILLADGDGRARLRIGVTPQGEPRIEFVATDGKVTYALHGDGPRDAP